VQVTDGLSRRGKAWLDVHLDDRAARRAAIAEFRSIMEAQSDVKELALTRNPEWVLLHTYLLLEELHYVEGLIAPTHAKPES